MVESNSSNTFASSRRGAPALIVPLVFIAAFLLPLLALSLFGRVPNDPPPSSHDPFSKSLLISNDPSFVRVAAAEGLNPSQGKDSLLFLWFKLRRLPEPNQKMTIISKIDDRQRVRPGYAIVVSGEKTGGRFSVYWQDLSGKGGWFPFSDLPLRAGVWTMVALSFSEDRYIGVHSAMVERGKKISRRLAGGHELKDVVIAASDSDLIIGAQKGGQFRGMIGPYGFISGKGLGARFQDILKDLAREPLKRPVLPSDNQLRLFVPEGTQDLSAIAHSISTEGLGGTKKRRGAINSKDSNEDS